MCIYTPELVETDKMRMSVSSQKSTAQVDLMLEQSLQNAFKSKVNVLLQGYSDVF